MLLQGIFPTQGSSLGLLHCRQILYSLSYKSHFFFLFAFVLFNLQNLLRGRWEPLDLVSEVQEGLFEDEV